MNTGNIFFDSGRIRELRSLQELYDRDEFSFAVVYGRRRVGKSSLISEFIKRGDKKAIRFIAAEQTDIINREAFSQAVFSIYPESSAFGIFPTWETAFDYIVKQSKGEKLIVEIDEYPYIAKAHPPISSELQRCVDSVLQHTDIMLILCGSSMTFMENKVLGYQSPLYGRRTAQYRLEPLDYYDSAEFFGDADKEDKLLGYAVTGGIPHYLKVISRAKNIKDGIEKEFFTKEGFMYEEPNNLLKEELRETAVYNAIISAIAGGATELNKISSKIKEEDSKVAKYIRNLMTLRIVERDMPVFSKNERGGRYTIKDGMYRFWHRFVPSAASLIENGCHNVYGKMAEPFISDFMEPVFETACRQYLMRLNIKDELPFLFNRIGRWWGGNPITKTETEIDIIAASDEKAILGECKWTNKKAGTDIYTGLRDKAAAVPQLKDRGVYFYLFSRSGFTESLIREADGNDSLRLADLNDMFNV